MSATITPLRRPAAARKRRRPSRAQVLARLRRESERAYKARHIKPCSDLDLLAYMARTAGWRARSVMLHGIRFPLRRGLAMDVVACPDTGMALVGVLGI